VRSQTTEQLVVELARHLAPVRPVRRLRVVFAGILVTAAAVAAAVLALRGVATPFLGSPGMRPVFAALAAGMGLLGAGATVAALAQSVPGREAALRAGLLAASVGILLVGGVVLLMRSASPGPPLAVPVSADLGCLLWAAGVGIVPAFAALWFIAQAAPHRPGFSVLVAAVGAVALGSLATQLSCPYVGLRHLILGHVLAPVSGGLVVAVLLGSLLGRLQRR
jgi:hypothetical protein